MTMAKNKQSEIEELFGGDKPSKKKAGKKAGKKAAKKATKKKVSKKKAAARSLDAGVRGRASGEARGVPGVNTNQILREVFSSAKGATPEQGTAAIMDATTGTKGYSGTKYTEDMAMGRVKKFLYGYRGRGMIENLGEISKGPRAGETKYRFTGEVAIQRGRPGTSEKAQKASKKKASKKKVSKKKK